MQRTQSVIQHSRNGNQVVPKAAKEASDLSKHYPWLEQFNMDVRELMGTPLTLPDVWKLLTDLEGNVSPEVSKLKNKPNRATKFLTQIKNKLSMVKISGLMTESPLEKNLFPTYGLLMTHLVNITLMSSKIERFGAEQIAGELYYNCKILFEGDTEYILDVALCSTLDEYAWSSNRVGFAFFKFIAEDWRHYFDSHSSQMKYCAVCALLSQACNDGKIVVDNVLPNQKLEKSFTKYLRTKLGLELNGPETDRRVRTIRALIECIKPNSIKSFSRTRLVIVSKRDVDGSRDCSASSDASSSTVNLPDRAGVCEVKQEMPSSSSAMHNTENSMNEILGQLGLDGFFFDTAGDDNQRGVDDDYYEQDQDEYNNNGRVTSSTYTRRSQSPVSSDNGENEKDEESDDEEDEEDAEIKSLESSSTASNRRKKSPVKSSPRRSYTRKSPVLQDDEDEGDLMIDTGSETEEKKKKPAKKLEYEDDEESDLEILEEKIEKKGSQNDSGDDSGSRDEAEAESGEDYVPNYDEDSDAEQRAASEETKAMVDELLSSTSRRSRSSNDGNNNDESDKAENDGSHSSSPMKTDEEKPEIDASPKHSPSKTTTRKSKSPVGKTLRDKEGVEETPSKRAKLSDDEVKRLLDTDAPTSVESSQTSDHEKEEEENEEQEVKQPKPGPPTPQMAKRGRARPTQQRSSTKPSVSSSKTPTPVVVTRRSARAITKTYGYDDDVEDKKEEEKQQPKTTEESTSRRALRVRKPSNDDNNKEAEETSSQIGTGKMATRSSGRSTARRGRGCCAAATPTVTTRSSTRHK